MDKSSALEYINQMFPTGKLSAARIESMIPSSHARAAAAAAAAAATMRSSELCCLSGLLAS
jgi:hypothetical protein